MSDEPASQPTEDEPDTEPAADAEQDNQQLTDDELDLNDATPHRVKTELLAYKNRLVEIGVTIKSISENYYTDDDGEKTEELKSLVLRCEWQRTPFLVIIPINESFTLFQAEYDLLENIIYSSNDAQLGGNFQSLSPEDRWDTHKDVREAMSPDQAVGLCRANRSVPMPTIDARIGLLGAASSKFTIDPSRVEFEYIGAVAVRRVYHSANDFSTQELYETVLETTDLYRGIQNILGGAYLLNGIEVPDDYDTIGKEVDNSPAYDRDAFQ